MAPKASSPLQRTKQLLSRPRPQTPVKPYPYREEQVAFMSGSGRVDIASTLTTAEGAGPFPAAVLIAGHKSFFVLA
jgi:hypothetical protein